MKKKLILFFIALGSTLFSSCKKSYLSLPRSFNNLNFEMTYDAVFPTSAKIVKGKILKYSEKDRNNILQAYDSISSEKYDINSYNTSVGRLPSCYYFNVYDGNTNVATIIFMDVIGNTRFENHLTGQKTELSFNQTDSKEILRLREYMVNKFKVAVEGEVEITIKSV